MKLSAPKKVVWIIALVLAVLALACRFIPAVPADCSLAGALLSAVILLVATALSNV